MSQEARALNIQKSSIQNYFSLTKWGAPPTKKTL
jgi:hypothetical protein